jgi:hypothetical protein
LVLTAWPGASELAVINGVQIAWKEAGLAPEITVQPEGQSLKEGDTLVLNVEAEGEEPLNFQWRLDGVDIPEADSATLRIEGIPTTMAGLYDVVVSNAFGSTASTPVRVAVEPKHAGKLAIVRTDRGLSVSIPAELGKIYTVEVSRDLRVWEPIAILFNITGTIEFLDPSEVSIRFYRLLEGFPTEP